jgi:dihydroorotase-like cyclic amidohydrolase
VLREYERAVVFRLGRSRARPLGPGVVLLLPWGIDRAQVVDTRTKVMPPLRTTADQEALLEALGDGTIDCIATDHAPHSPVEKDVEFECAAPGMLGLETALPIILDFVRMGSLDERRAIAALTGAVR